MTAPAGQLLALGNVGALLVHIGVALAASRLRRRDVARTAIRLSRRELS